MLHFERTNDGTSLKPENIDLLYSAKSGVIIVYDLVRVMAELVQRLLLAECLCARWCPGELEARLDEITSLRQKR